MKRVVSFIAVILMLVSLAMPAFATEEGFVPSITYKPTPDITPVEDGHGQSHIGRFRDEAGEIVGYLDEGCLIVTPIADVWDEEKNVPLEIEDLLLFVYDGLSGGTLTIPYEKLEADLNASNMVIRDLFDVRLVCDECQALLDQEGIVLEVTFDLGVVAEAEIFVLTYGEVTGEWEPIVSVENNGDGTVTCVFEHLCAVVFTMPVVGTATQAPVEEVAAPGAGATPWIILLIIAAVAVVAIVISKKKKIAA